MRGECKNFRASGVSLFHPHGWVVAHAIVLQPGHCHLTWQGFSRLGAATLPIILPISIAAHSLGGTSPLSKWFSTPKTSRHEATPFGSCFLCYQCSLEKKCGKCNLSAEQTFPRLEPSETSFVENIKVVANNLGGGGKIK